MRRCLDSLLRDRRFGDAGTIAGRSTRALEQRVAWLAQQLRSSSVLSTLSERDRVFVLSLPGVRVRIERALRAVYGGSSDGLQEWRALESRLRDLGQRARANELEAASKAGGAELVSQYPLVTVGWLGDSGSGEDAGLNGELGELFEEIIPSAGSEACCLRTLARHQIQAIRESLRRLSQRSEAIVRDVAVNVRQVALVDFKRWRSMPPGEYRAIAQSFSRHPLPSCVFLSEHAFRSAAVLDESLFHETLHRKLGSLLLCEEIFRPGYDSSTGPVFECGWNKPVAWNSNQWRVDRALDAFHVYAHLIPYYEEHGDSIGEEDWVDRRISDARVRAGRLGEWLVGHLAEFGEGGRELVRWLQSFVGEDSMLSEVGRKGALTITNPENS